MKTKTEEELKAEEHPAAEDRGNAPTSLPADFCPVGYALEMIGARWTLVLVRHLLAGPRGFQELRERTGIGPRVLSTRLRELAERGLVEKVPVGNRSHYALTELGQTLEPVVREIALWWVQNAMVHSGPFEQTTPAAAMEAISFLLRRDRAREAEFTCDLRLTVRDGGGWTMEISDAPLREVPAERAESRDAERAEGRDAEHAEGRDAADAHAGGSIAWYPGWMDRPDQAQ